MYLRLSILFILFGYDNILLKSNLPISIYIDSDKVIIMIIG